MANFAVDGLTDLQEIGRGGFGVVYRATETDLGRTVAAKILQPLLDEAAQLRFERERLALGAMSGHPNIVTIHRSGRTADERPFLVMEFCDRGSIGDEVDRSGPLDWARATEIVVKIAGALETAHRAGIVHRDIKPANILISNLNEPKLADFGIARVDGAPETQTSSITASIAHAAPEVLDGRRPDARSDVYSLGSTLYELLIGAPAFVRPGDDSMLPILNRIARDPVPLMPGHIVPPAVAELIVRSMAKRPEDRPATAHELGRQLAEAQQRSGAVPTTMMVEGQTPPPTPPAGAQTVAVDAPFAAPAPATYSPPSSSWDHTAQVDQKPDPFKRSRAPIVAAVVGGLILLGGLGAVIALAAGNGGDGADSSTAETFVVGDSIPETTAPADGTVPVVPPDPVVDGDALVIGSLLPQSGNLVAFGPQTQAAVEIAVEDINSAGGVLGQPVVLVAGDSGDQDPALVRSEAARLAGEGAGFIVGPFTSSDSRSLIGDPSTDGVVLISPSATSQNLSDLDTDGTFFRTAPTEVTMANVTAQALIDSGVDRLALVHTDDEYGAQISEGMRLRFAQLGGVIVVNTAYDPVGDIGPVAAELIASEANGIVIIGFGETVDILAALRADGIGPTVDGTPVFGVDVNFLLDGDPEVIDGFRATYARIDLRPLTPFTSRLEALGISDFGFTPEAYDAAIIGALAAESSGAVSGPELAAAVVEVTRNGEKCFDFAECKRMIAEGADIDFDGLGGPYEMTDAGDPRVASYVIITYDGDARSNEALDEYVFSR